MLCIHIRRTQITVTRIVHIGKNSRYHLWNRHRRPLIIVFWILHSLWVHRNCIIRYNMIYMNGAFFSIYCSDNISLRTLNVYYQSLNPLFFPPP